MCCRLQLTWVFFAAIRIPTTLEPPSPLPAGLQHSKFFILQYDDKLRVIIHTANLTQEQMFKTQGVWWQDFRFKGPASPSSCRFEEDLLDYLTHYAVPKGEQATPWHQLLAQMRKVDFSDARCLGLVASVPGYHRGENARKYGHMKVRALLEAREFDACFQSAPLV